MIKKREEKVVLEMKNMERENRRKDYFARMEREKLDLVHKHSNRSLLYHATTLANLYLVSRNARSSRSGTGGLPLQPREKRGTF